jgi:hypothetical protein
MSSKRKQYSPQLGLNGAMDDRNAIIHFERNNVIENPKQTLN